MTGRKQPIFDLGPSSYWLCERCGARGPANFGPDQPAFAAVENIRASHAKQSPTCKGGNGYQITVHNLESSRTKGAVA